MSRWSRFASAAGTGDRDREIGSRLTEIRCRFDEHVEPFSWDQAADADDDAPLGREAEAASGRVDRLGVERMKALRIDTGRNDDDLRHRRTREAALRAPGSCPPR